MKNTTLKYLILSVLILAQAGFSNLLSQEEAASIASSATIKYMKVNDDKGQIHLSLTCSPDGGEMPLIASKVLFYSVAGQPILVSEVMTDERGVATLAIDEAMNLKKDENGSWTFRAEFQGNDSIAPASAELTVRNLDLQMVLSEADSIKTITVTAVSLINGEAVPAAGETVKLFIPRMFSRYTVADLTLDDAGSASLEFPNDLPGDSTGNLRIVALVEENAAYGNVERSAEMKWGVPTSYSVPSTHRALWTKTAPRWMIITLSVLLTGVWGHYMFAVISLILIKVDANRKKARDEYRL